MQTIKLNSGRDIPVLGLGVYQIDDAAECERTVREALERGYRLVDTAAAYGNEEAVGKAVAKSGIPREDIFVTSKLWLQDYGYEAARKGTETSLAKLGLKYIDLYLLHQPYGDVVGAWKALEDMKAEGRLRSIGVSNMTPNIWNQYVPQFKTLPAVDQVECNPFFQQKKLREVLDPLGVKIEAYFPLDHGDEKLLSHPVILSLAEKYKRSASQLVLRFEVQEGFIVLPKSMNQAHIKENIGISEFSLAEEDMRKIRALDAGKGTHDPEADGVAEMLLSAYKVHD